jgi:uncharacterized membrane protein (DUF441 family)
MFVNPYLLVIFVHLWNRKASVYRDSIYSAGLNECGIKLQQNEEKLVAILLSGVVERVVFLSRSNVHSTLTAPSGRVYSFILF